MSKLLKIVLLLLTIPVVLSLSASCRQGPPPPLPNDGGRGGSSEDDRFIDLYAHSLIIREEDRLTKSDSAHTRARIDSLLATRSVSRESFDDTIERYRVNLAAWKAFHEKVLRRLEEIQRTETGQPIS